MSKGIRLSLEIAFSVNVVTAIVIGKRFTLSVECRPKLSTATQDRTRKKDVDLSYFFVFRLSPSLPLSLSLRAPVCPSVANIPVAGNAYQTRIARKHRIRKSFGLSFNGLHVAYQKILFSNVPRECQHALRLRRERASRISFLLMLILL